MRRFLPTIKSRRVLRQNFSQLILRKFLCCCEKVVNFETYSCIVLSNLQILLCNERPTTLRLFFYSNCVLSLDPRIHVWVILLRCKGAQIFRTRANIVQYPRTNTWPVAENAGLCVPDLKINKVCEVLARKF